MIHLLKLNLINATGRGQVGPLLVSIRDVESVRPAYHRLDVIGSLVRTRSGETHCVSEQVDTIERALLEFVEGQE